MCVKKWTVTDMKQIYKILLYCHKNNLLLFFVLILSIIECLWYVSFLEMRKRIN